MVSDVSKLLSGAFGEDFLRFVLNLPDSQSLETIPERIPADVVHLLTSLALDSASNGFADVYYTAASHLTSPVEGHDTSLVHLLRAMCGGGPPEVVQDDGDSLLYLLRCIMRDCWPAYLITPPLGQEVNNFFAASPAGALHHPMAAKAAEAFMQDSSLKNLFPADGDENRSTDLPLMESADWVVNVGGGGQRHLVAVISGLLYDARLRVAANGHSLSYPRLAECLGHSLTALRQLAEGKEVSVPAVIGLSGIAMKEGESVEFTDGTLRGVRPAERQLLLRGSGAVGAVYETTYPARIIEVFKGDPTSDDWVKPFRKHQAKVEEAFRSFEYALDKVRMALVLNPDEKAFLAPKEETRLIIEPINMGGSGYLSTGEMMSANIEVSPDKHGDLVSLYDVIRKKHPESLNIAMKRLLSAVTSRRDSNDALIDALIAWENIFGTRSETTFRVTASLSKILAESTEERIKLQRDLGKLYAVRSAMVHGAKEPAPDVAAQNRERVIRVAINALRCLYLERPELLSMVPEDRSKRVLLED